LITLVTGVYRKTNVFITTVSTVTPPDDSDGKWSIAIATLDDLLAIFGSFELGDNTHIRVLSTILLQKNIQVL
jgi:hypothetical protein